MYAPSFFQIVHIALLQRTQLGIVYLVRRKHLRRADGEKQTEAQPEQT